MYRNLDNMTSAIKFQVNRIKLYQEKNYTKGISLPNKLFHSLLFLESKLILKALQEEEQ